MKYVLALVFLSIMLVFLLPQNAESAPPTSEFYEKHRNYVDLIISMQEKPPIKEQMKKGIPAYNVICNNDFVLVLKWTNNNSACVSTQTAEKLVERNWGAHRKNVNDFVNGDDPRKVYVEPPTTASFEYDTSKYKEAGLFKKIREKISEYFKESSDYYTRDYVWAPMSLIKESEGYFTLRVYGTMSEKWFQGSLEKIEGISNIEYHGQDYYL